VVVLTLVMVATSPLWALVAWLLSAVQTGRRRLLRLLWLVTVYLLVETGTLIAMLGLWIGSGFGWKVSSPAFQRAHYLLCGRALRILYRQACWVLEVSVQITGVTPSTAPHKPLIVLSRHAGPGDSFLLAHALINWYDREPRIILKDTLLWDPTIDVLLNRLPSRFLAPGGGERATEQIGDLATGLDNNDALVIFPEGGNFTPERWQKAIDRLRRLGLHAMVRKAQRMTNVLAPRPGGVLAALDASPDAHVIWVAHTGVDHLRTVGDIWRELPMDKTIATHWWLVPPADIPAGDEARIEWLYMWWARIDGWISEHRPVLAAIDR
jgi:1-acyl-sn-glycerol-3-phosphate acyltransferase